MIHLCTPFFIPSSECLAKYRVAHPQLQADVCPYILQRDMFLNCTRLHYLKIYIYVDRF